MFILLSGAQILLQIFGVNLKGKYKKHLSVKHSRVQQQKQTSSNMTMNLNKHLSKTASTKVQEQVIAKKIKNLNDMSL